MQSVRFLSGLLTVILAVLLPGPVCAFETGTPLSFQVEPATIRQQNTSKAAKAIATVTLQEPAPDVFVCRLRSQEQLKISFPTIVFHKGDLRATSEGVVHWKAVLGQSRVRVTAYNVEAPDKQLSFTVTLVPSGGRPGMDGEETSGPGRDQPTGALP